MKVYECVNELCTLGSRTEPGRFTEGSTKRTLEVMGLPLDTPHGEGYCPNCAEKGKLVEGESFKPHKGNDPYQKYHDEIAKRVADPSDPLNADGAQEALMELLPAEERVGDGDENDS